MRTWLIAGIVFAAAVAVILWSSGSALEIPSPPGQYPLNKARPSWSSIQSVGQYRPRGHGDQDALAPSAFVDAKMSCGSDRTVNKRCTLPTVPLGPQYEPTLLETTDPSSDTSIVGPLLQSLHL